MKVQFEKRLFFLPFNPVVSVHRKEEKEMQQPRLFPPSRIDILQFSCKQDRRSRLALSSSRLATLL